MPNRLACLILILTLMLGVCVFELLYVRNSVSSVSAVEATAGMGVYWDPSCTNSVLSISWGTLSPGRSADVVVYVRNEGNESILLTVVPINFSPSSSSSYLSLSWTCANTTILPGETVQVTTSLFVSPETTGISSFGFDVMFGKESILGDFYADGVVNMLDVVLVEKAFGSTPGSPNWNPACDLDQNGKVDMGDVMIVLENFGRSV